MAAQTYLRVRNWEKFQHYKNRRPPWIKFYVELLDDYDLTAQPIAVQLVYDRLLLLAAKHENLIPNDSEWIANQIRIDRKTITNAIAALLKGAWLSETKTQRRASKVLAARKQSAMPETETEKDPPIPQRRRANGTNPRANGTNPRAKGSSPRQRGTNARSNGNGDAPPKIPCPECGVKLYTDKQVTEHLENVHPTVTVPDDLIWD